MALAGQSRRRVVAPLPPPPPSGFTTNFAATENPITEGSKWVNGSLDGVHWSNVKTASGHALASRTMEAAPSRYSDDIATLSPGFQVFTPNQYAQGTVFKTGGYSGNGGNHEIELLLRFNAATGFGYEVLWGIQGYVAIVRWEGWNTGTNQTQYTALYDPGLGSIAVPQDGDVLKATIVGSTITVYRAPASTPTVFSQVATASDGTYGSGQPGLGFWPVDQAGGNIAANTDNLGWKSFTADNL